MRIPVLISFIGFVVLIMATFCPILKLFYVVNWDVYDGNMPYGIVILLVGVVGILGTVFNQVNIIRLAARLALGLVILFYLLTLLKIYTSFGFISINTNGVKLNTSHSIFHSIDKFLVSKVKFMWGIYVLFLGGILAFAGTLLNKNISKFKVG
jgi:hypothetical protein